VELFSRFVAVSMIVIISPVMFAIGLTSLIFQGFPILYKQERVGFKFKSFSLFKFRTMKRNDGKELITNPNDNRITFWGKILRRFKLDELPQLMNIVKGEMRFIGPRPEVKEYVNENDFLFLNKIKPGLTDFSSILLRDEELILEKAGGVEAYSDLLKLKVELGQLYAQHKRFWLDLQLVVLTMVSIVFPQTAIHWVKKYYIEKYNPELIPEIDKWIA
jgi:lipopolysaccharide/colanic/teichoic acid biosynthesis glycosyltransferase